MTFPQRSPDPGFSLHASFFHLASTPPRTSTWSLPSPFFPDSFSLQQPVSEQISKRIRVDEDKRGGPAFYLCFICPSFPQSLSDCLTLLPPFLLTPRLTLSFSGSCLSTRSSVVLLLLHVFVLVSVRLSFHSGGETCSSKGESRLKLRAGLQNSYQFLNIVVSCQCLRVTTLEIHVGKHFDPLAYFYSDFFVIRRLIGVKMGMG